jgi:tetratricopeptide (TPR) repeat protein
MRVIVPLLIMLLALPAFAEDRAAARRAQTDGLLDALKKAQTETEAAVIEAHLRRLWFEAGSAAVTLLMARGLRDLRAGSNKEAEQDFNDALTLDPNVAEAFDQRAIARLQQGNVDGAVRDIGEALKREPRNFLAFRHLAEAAEARRDWAAALAAWQKLLEIDPKTPGGEEKLKELRRRALGENT